MINSCFQKIEFTGKTTRNFNFSLLTTELHASSENFRLFYPFCFEEKENKWDRYLDNLLKEVIKTDRKYSHMYFLNFVWSNPMTEANLPIHLPSEAQSYALKYQNYIDTMQWWLHDHFLIVQKLHKWSALSSGCMTVVLITWLMETFLNSFPCLQKASLQCGCLCWPGWGKQRGQALPSGPTSPHSKAGKWYRQKVAQQHFLPEDDGNRSGSGPLLVKSWKTKFSQRICISIYIRKQSVNLFLKMVFPSEKSTIIWNVASLPLATDKYLWHWVFPRQQTVSLSHPA